MNGSHATSVVDFNSAFDLGNLPDVADAEGFRRALSDAQTVGPDTGSQRDSASPAAAAFVAPPSGAPVGLPPPVAMGDAAAGAAGAALARTGLGTAGAVAAAGAILLIPSNTRRTIETAAVDGHPDLGARISRAPGDLSGQVTIFARGAGGQPNRDLTTLQMDPAGQLTAPPGTAAHDGVLLGRRTPTGNVQLAPDAAAALDARVGAPAQAGADGAGGKQPPGSIGAVRPDGECDEDGNVGASSPRSRLPTNGRWTGDPGNSGWLSNDPEVQAVTRGEPIRFRDGRADFTKWSRLSLNFRPGALTGIPPKDHTTALQALDASGNPDIHAVGSAEKFLRNNRLAVHHATDTCIQLVPDVLNRRVAHIGSAADIRYQNSTGKTP